MLGKTGTGKREVREEDSKRSKQSIIGTRRGAMALSGGREAHR